MFYHLAEPLQDLLSGFRLLEYITFRAAFAALLAFLVATVVGPGIVRSLRQRKIAGFTRTGSAAVDQRRGLKAEVPTMGGVILLVGVGLSGLLFARLNTPYTWIVLVSFLLFGALGALDDWRKLNRGGGHGLPERAKLAGQLLIAAAAIGSLYVLGSAEAGLDLARGPSVKPSPYPRAAAAAPATPAAPAADAPPGPGAPASPRPRAAARDRHRTDLQVPFFKHVCVDLGWLFLPFGLLVIVGASNAVNLTDGLDGLAIGTTATVTVALGVVAYLVGRVDFSQELQLFYVPEAGEIAVILAALLGGALGFLWFNCYPASVFMGDTGSLSIGGILGVTAVALRHELTLLIAGGLFVAEAASVLWQRAFFKWTRRSARRAGDPAATGRRWFRCAPVHHHYEQGGWHENQVTVRFWIVSVICVIAALATLKTR